MKKHDKVLYSWRDMAIYLAREDGMKLRAIGAVVGLCHERVRQIWARGDRKKKFHLKKLAERDQHQDAN